MAGTVTRARAPDGPSATGWARISDSGRAAWLKPSQARTASARSSTIRNSPVTRALVRMLNTPSRVAPATVTSATGIAGKPGSTAFRYSPTPSANTAAVVTEVSRFKPRMAKPGRGPRMRPTMAYSPPLSGKAEDSSA